MKFSSKVMVLIVALMMAATLPFATVTALAKQAPDSLPRIEYSAAYEFNMAAEEEIFRLVNDLRQNPHKYSLDTGKAVSTLHQKTHLLTRSSVIKKIARYKSMYMAAYNDFNHLYTSGPLSGVGSGGTSELVFFDTMYWAENIAYRSTTASYTGREFGERLFYQWLNSPGHLSAMMSPRVYYIGIGVVAIRKNSSVYVYGTQQFSYDNPATSKDVPVPLTTTGNEGTIISTSGTSSATDSSWQKVGSGWYLLRNGSVQTGWQKVDGKWYYMDKGTGIMLTGWVKDGNTWYYCNSNGAMLTGWCRVGGRWYYLRGSGAMATGWVKLGGKWYYLYGNGAMATNWLKLGDKWYHLDPASGVMTTGFRTINGIDYYFSSAGVMTQQQ